jgi:hypothetical protein
MLFLASFTVIGIVSLLGSELAPRSGGLLLLGRIVLVGYGVNDISPRKFLPLTISPWIVPREWASRDTVAGAAGFGASLGAGFLTKIPVGLFPAVVLTVFLVPSSAAFICCGLGFAAGRTIPVVFGGIYSLLNIHPGELVRLFRSDTASWRWASSLITFGLALGVGGGMASVFGI